MAGGRLAAAEFKRVEDRAVDEAEQLQGRGGARCRHYAFFGHLIDALEGFDKVGSWAIPFCGRRLRLVATIEDPHVIRAILAHLGLSAEVPQPDPPQPPPAYATGHTADVVA